MKSISIKKPKTVEIVENQKPTFKKNEALLKLLYGGICGSDLSSYRGTFTYFDYPRTPGHEFSAEIIDVSENDKGLKPGMIVTCNPYFNCENCYSCNKGILNACMDNQTMGVQREGAFSEYIVMPIDRIYNGNGLDPKILAIVEPFCISWHGVERGNVKPNDKVLIIGSGTIGVFAGISAKLKGAQVYISDVDLQKLNYVKENFNFDGIILNSSFEDFKKCVDDITNSNGFDVCIEAVGLPSTFQACIDSVCFGGNIVLIGVGKKNLDFNFTIIQKKELNIYGSRNSLKKDFYYLIDMLKKNNMLVEKIITHIYNWKDAKKAFDDFDKNSSDVMLKVLLDFTK